MALTEKDLSELRVIIRDEVKDAFEINGRSMVRDEVHSIVSSQLGSVNDKLDAMTGRIKALENDVHDIYLMLAKRNAGSPNFSKLNLEEKIRTTYEQLKITAKEAGITLEH